MKGNMTYLIDQSQSDSYKTFRREASMPATKSSPVPSIDLPSAVSTRWNLWRTCVKCSGGIPIPVSDTASTKSDWWDVSLTVIDPCLVYLKANEESIPPQQTVTALLTVAEKITESFVRSVTPPIPREPTITSSHNRKGRSSRRHRH